MKWLWAWLWPAPPHEHGWKLSSEIGHVRHEVCECGRQRVVLNDSVAMEDANT